MFDNHQGQSSAEGQSSAAANLRRRPKGERPSSKTLLAAILVGAALWSFASAGGLRTFNNQGLDTLTDILLAAATPDVSPSYLLTVAEDAVITVAYAVTSMVFAVVIGLAGALAASGLLIKSSKSRLATIAVSRSILALLRSMHELIWALLFVSAFGLTPWAGILAIAIPYGGIIARILADQLQDVPSMPVQALTATGASRTQLLLYGYVPQVYPQMFSYLMYRFECALRAAAVLGFVGLGGLGFRFEIALDDLFYHKAWTPIWALILLVVIFDRLSRSAQGYFAR